MRATDTVIFDLDDTLHDDTIAYREAAVTVGSYAAERFGIDPVEVADAFVRISESFWETLTPESMATLIPGMNARWWGQALAEFGIRDREFAGWCAFSYEQARAKNLELYPGVGEMLHGLRTSGIKLGLLTNGFSQTHREKITLLGLERAFDQVFIADEIGMVKPDPAVFIYACGKLDTNPQKAAMVGDRYDRDIVGANEAGLFTVWVNPTRGEPPYGAPKPDAVVHKIAQTPSVLRLVSSGRP